MTLLDRDVYLLLRPELYQIASLLELADNRMLPASVQSKWFSFFSLSISLSICTCLLLSLSLSLSLYIYIYIYTYTSLLIHIYFSLSYSFYISLLTPPSFSLSLSHQLSHIKRNYIKCFLIFGNLKDIMRMI